MVGNISKTPLLCQALALVVQCTPPQPSVQTARGVLAKSKSSSYTCFISCLAHSTAAGCFTAPSGAHTDPQLGLLQHSNTMLTNDTSPCTQQTFKAVTTHLPLARHSLAKQGWLRQPLQGTAATWPTACERAKQLGQTKSSIQPCMSKWASTICLCTRAQAVHAPA